MCVHIYVCILSVRVRAQIELSKLAFIPVFTKANGKLRKWITFRPQEEKRMSRPGRA
jgi:hypothetical protein